MSSYDDALKDIAKRHAGTPVLTVWKDGSYLIHGELDAEIATRCEPDEVLLSLYIETMEPMQVPDLQGRIKLYEAILPLAHQTAEQRDG